MEMQGLLMRGGFEQAATDDPATMEWCERRILQRIHRATMAHARRQVEAVSPQVFYRWLTGWQHLAPQTQLTGEEGLLEVLASLEGFEAPAVEWERTLLPARLANYDPQWLDQLCLSGAVGWGRISPHPAWSASDGPARPRRVIPTNAAPITFYLRDSAAWLPQALGAQAVDERALAESLSPEALRVREMLALRGACFAPDLERLTGFTKQQVAHALWELATAGLAASDGFDQLRALMDPKRRSATPEGGGRRRIARTTAGRWSLFSEPLREEGRAPLSAARRADEAVESFARILLTRYGVLFRDLIARENNAPRWREVLGVLRRMEHRGEVRGGRFVTGFSGEQYALPEAVDSLREARTGACGETLRIAGADPVNLAGILTQTERVPAVPHRFVLVRDGIVVDENGAAVSAAQQSVKERASRGQQLSGAAMMPVQTSAELPLWQAK
jgi:ATP-dependent Lhr-like helicase